MNDVPMPLSPINNAIKRKRLLDLVDKAIDKWHDSYPGERPLEMMEVLNALEFDCYQKAAYLVRSFSLEANGCTPTKLQDWAKNYA